jgi:hypothetical protein
LRNPAEQAAPPEIPFEPNQRLHGLPLRRIARQDAGLEPVFIGGAGA